MQRMTYRIYIHQWQGKGLTINPSFSLIFDGAHPFAFFRLQNINFAMLCYFSPFLTLPTTLRIPLSALSFTALGTLFNPLSPYKYSFFVCIIQEWNI